MLTERRAHAAFKTATGVDLYVCCFTALVQALLPYSRSSISTVGAKESDDHGVVKGNNREVFVLHN